MGMAKEFLCRAVNGYSGAVVFCSGISPPEHRIDWPGGLQATPRMRRSFAALCIDVENFFIFTSVRQQGETVT